MHGYWIVGCYVFFFLQIVSWRSNLTRYVVDVLVWSSFMFLFCCQIRLKSRHTKSKLSVDHFTLWGICQAFLRVWKEEESIRMLNNVQTHSCMLCKVLYKENFTKHLPNDILLRVFLDLSPFILEYSSLKR